MPVYLDRLVTTLDAAAMAGCGRAPVRVQGANNPRRAALFRLSQIFADCRLTAGSAPGVHRRTAARPIHVSRHRRSVGGVPNALFRTDRAAVRSGDLIHSPDVGIPLSKRTQA
ncbi:hypothetical protein [Aurantimonas coralicida]|uniref:hypothetical protein n=1 Tax=Aurantimonas coralicida TaxID=182270 RepID=UPI001E32DF2A|nr:hypothetical protein [Aurantimonas coralicida]MCD1644250.1 hypothetical protein [Aurantimonas coralicida]